MPVIVPPRTGDAGLQIGGSRTGATVALAAGGAVLLLGAGYGVLRRLKDEA
jgi:uncharacterized protein YjlB